MQATDFLVGKFTIQMRPNDLYCCPIKKDEQDINLHDRRLSYATLKTSTCFNKKCSETVWFYMNGNRDKVDRYIQTPQDAIALCAVLFSEVIRYPDMFFHNILLMQHLKSWEEFHDNHPMLTGGSWKGGSSKPDQVIVPEKVKQREEKNLFSCVKNIMRRQEKEELYSTVLLKMKKHVTDVNCVLFLCLLKSLCHFFLHRKLLKKIHHCAHT